RPDAARHRVHRRVHGDGLELLFRPGASGAGGGTAGADRSQARRAECRAAAAQCGGRGTNMTSVKVNAAIVGGGPAGVMLGLLLAQRGASGVVVEGAETVERGVRGEVLQPSPAHLLNELGLLEYILEQPHSIIDSGKVRMFGRDIADISFRKIAPEFPYAIWMPQSIFLAALLRKAEPLPSFQCWMSAHVSGLIEEDGACVGVRGTRHGAEPFEVRADVVIGADGRYSAIAKMGGFTAAYEHHDFDLIWFTIEQPEGWANTFRVSLGDSVRGLM